MKEYLEMIRNANLEKASTKQRIKAALIVRHLVSSIGEPDIYRVLKQAELELKQAFPGCQIRLPEQVEYMLFDTI